MGAVACADEPRSGEGRRGPAQPGRTHRPLNEKPKALGLRFSSEESG